MGISMRAIVLSLFVLLLITSPVRGQDWTGTEANDSLVDDLMARGLTRELARARAAEIEEAARRQLEAAFPGMQDGRYSYDPYQDIRIGPDGRPPNCFGDVRGADRGRWEPSQGELEQWLLARGYSVEEDEGTRFECERGVQRVAVYVLVLQYRQRAERPIEEVRVPIHIAEQLEDCSWRSRMGNLGVLYHASPSQIWSTREQARRLGRAWCEENDEVFVEAEVEIECYSRVHERPDYHSRPRGPLDRE